MGINMESWAPMLNWDSNRDLGHDEIDAEHRFLLRLIVDFEEATIKGATKEELIALILEISKYAKFHFANEESIMAEFNYPDQSHHAHLHNELIAEVTEKLIQFRRDEVEPDVMFEFLLNWFALHTSHEDKELVNFIHGLGL